MELVSFEVKAEFGPKNKRCKEEEDRRNSQHVKLVVEEELEIRLKIRMRLVWTKKIKIP